MNHSTGDLGDQAPAHRTTSRTKRVQSITTSGASDRFIIERRSRLIK
jgi:hypothetical protein